jgi:hypothetical protein
VHTEDGVTADVWIGDQNYDLAQGNLFLVRSDDDGTQVEQLQRDLSGLAANFDDVSALASADQAIAGFIASNKSGNDATTGGAIAPEQVRIEPEPVTVETDIASALPEALANQDYDILQQLMGEPFVIGYWRSEGVVLTPAEAIEQLQASLLPSPAKLAFTFDREQFPDLDGVDPAGAFGPDVMIVDLVYSQGWGAVGEDETILAIAQRPDGRRYWSGMIYGPGGFVYQPDPLPEASTYRNEANKFEFGYPASWQVEEQVFGPRGSGAQFFSGGENVFSAVVFLWDPKSDLNAYADQRKLAWSSSSTVAAEEELTLGNGQRAFLFEIQAMDGSSTYSLLTEVGENYLELSSPLESTELRGIAQTLRFFETPAAGLEAELVLFEEQLATAIDSRDLAQMRALMGETFGFAFWGSQGYEASSEQAMVDLQNNYLPPGPSVSFEATEPDLSNILELPSILSIWNLARNPVSALFSTGWGAESLDEVYLIIVQEPDGSYAWDGIIVASGSSGGFAGLYNS